MTDHVVTTARRLAEEVHAGQVDKAGQPYIDHPARVAARVAGDPDAEAVAWLHDVVEDTDMTLERLREIGFPADIVLAVDAMTRREDEIPDDYYARVAANPLALKVKRADLADNSDPGRLALLQPDLESRLQAKYAHAAETLDRVAAGD